MIRVYPPDETNWPRYDEPYLAAKSNRASETGRKDCGRGVERLILPHTVAMFLAADGIDEPLGAKIMIYGYLLYGHFFGIFRETEKSCSCFRSCFWVN